MQTLTKIRDSVTELLYWAQLSQGTYSTIILSFVLISTNLDRIRLFVPWNPYLILLILTPIVFSGTIFIGWFMDRIIGYAKKYAETANRRNPQILGTHEIVQRTEKRLEK